MNNYHEKSIKIAKIVSFFTRNYTYDYEINNIKLDESNILNCKMYYYDNFYKENRIINYNDFKDNLKKNPFTPSTI